ncbi:WecB/TagA/CpsF family glycosyltransferase [Actinomadura sp. NEAU-AAG7]|uniref:WecB/TagA/CpsF family glycosyltransferase n=1 Tax=Actinomadura sp. NEAU-AAG7 TaxID=2839640 RepID=UPI001BE49497|nr:WecB/TagA/CpsF family glycosyltransferase [Actinomadura sp. NEAU-AAG7]MBT2209007.1 WecB/TagA/CpsF family glycosyltransferase [Actinomadura sp. NEAU-AAG7]
MKAQRSEPDRRRFLGVHLDPLTIDETVARCVKAVEERSPITIGVLNAAKIVRLRKDPRLSRAVLGCDLVLADGQSVVWASALLRRPLPERVAGIDLMLTLLPEAERRGHRVFFLGARQEVLDRTVAEVRRRFPGLVVAGTRHGYFSTAEAPGVADEIRAAEADLLFIGVSSPMKELFVQDWSARTGAQVVHGVGGTFDVLAGEVRRAPEWWQRRGLEWLYRCIQEPMRLGPRYFTTNFAFVVLVAREVALEVTRKRMPGRGRSSRSARSSSASGGGRP